MRIDITVNGDHLIGKKNIVVGTKNYYVLKGNFSEDWETFDKYVVFPDDELSVAFDENNEAVLPERLIEKKGVLKYGILGKLRNEVRVCTNCQEIKITGEELEKRENIALPLDENTWEGYIGEIASLHIKHMEEIKEDAEEELRHAENAVAEIEKIAAEIPFETVNTAVDMSMNTAGSIVDAEGTITADARCNVAVYGIDGDGKRIVKENTVYKISGCSSAYYPLVVFESADGGIIGCETGNDESELKQVNDYEVTTPKGTACMYINYFAATEGSISVLEVSERFKVDRDSLSDEVLTALDTALLTNVRTIADRDAIPVERRYPYMRTTVQEDGETYVLVGGLDNTCWIRESAKSTAMGAYKWNVNSGANPMIDEVFIMKNGKWTRTGKTLKKFENDNYNGTWFYVGNGSGDAGLTRYKMIEDGYTNTGYHIDGADGYLNCRDYVIWNGRWVRFNVYEAKASAVKNADGKYSPKSGVCGLMSSTDKAYLTDLINDYWGKEKLPVYPNPDPKEGWQTNWLFETGWYLGGIKKNCGGHPPVVNGNHTSWAVLVLNGMATDAESLNHNHRLQIAFDVQNSKIYMRRGWMSANTWADRWDEIGAVAAGSITANKIADGAVTYSKIGANAIFPSQIVNNAVTKEKLSKELQSRLAQFELDAEEQVLTAVFADNGNNVFISDLSSENFARRRQTIWLDITSVDSQAAYYLDFPTSAEYSQRIDIVAMPSTRTSEDEASGDFKAQILIRINTTVVRSITADILSRSSKLAVTLVPKHHPDGYVNWYI